MKQIINGVVHTSLGWVNGSVVYADGKIVEVKNDNTIVEGAEVIDAKGGYVVPGGVELHVHGGGGHDFTEGDEDPDIDYKLNFTFNKAQKRDVRVALSNTFGFGGHNTCIMFKKIED